MSTLYEGIILEATISRGFPTQVQVCFLREKSRSHKLEDEDPEDTLDSCSGTQNEQKNTHNNIIER